MAHLKAEVREALELLNKAALEEKEALRDVIDENYGELKEILEIKQEDIMNKFKETKDKIEEKVTDIDKKVHENPWPFLAGAFATALLVGFIMGNSKE